MNNDLDRLIKAHRDDIHAAPPHRVHQWHDVVDDAAALERGRMQNGAPRTRLYTWGLAISAALVVGIGIGLNLSDRNRENVVPDDFATASRVGNPNTIPIAFKRGLQVHLRDSRQQLVNASNDPETVMLALRIIEQNRLFEVAAERNNAVNLARVLRAFEPILLRLAATDVAPEDAEQLRAQLAFELKVMLTKLAQSTSDEAHTT